MDQRPLMLEMKFTTRAWDEHIRRLAIEAGVPEGYRATLMFIARHPGASQKAVAENNRVTSAAVSQTVRDMIADGYLYREADSEDLRTTRLFLTEKGRAADDRLREKVRAAENAVCEALTPGEFEETMRILRRVREVLAGEQPGRGHDC